MKLKKMITELKDKYYKFDEQQGIYDRYKSKLSNKDKYNLIKELMDDKFWGYFELIAKIVYELADISNEYLKLLEEVNNKVKNDMAQGPFLNTIINIGKNKEKIALKLYKKILKETKDESLIVISGLILGGYSQKNLIVLQNYIKKGIEYPLANSILKAILVNYEKSNMSEEIYSYFDRIMKIEDTRILREFANICLIFYNKDPEYFFNQIKKLVKLNDRHINYLIFDRLTYKDILNQEQIFELIELSKDAEDIVIDKIIETLRKYPEQYKQISEWLIYWLNKGLKFKLRNFDWILEELVEKNKLFISYFLENYKKIKTGKSNTYIIILPHLFRILSKYHKNYALEQIFKLNLSLEKDRYLFFELTKVILGNIYQDSNHQEMLFNLIDRLIQIADKNKYISFNKSKYEQRKQRKTFTKMDYDFLIDFADDLLNQLRNKKEDYHYELIRKNIMKYPNVNKYAKDIIDESESEKRYSPLVWLGEREEPNLSEIKISKKDSKLNKAFKINFARNQFWAKAYLKELDKDLEIIEKFSNEKFKDKKDLEKHIKNILRNENSFWNYYSELIFISKFKNSGIVKIEPQAPHRKYTNLDLKVNLFDRDIFFEIKQPQMDRSLRLANTAVGLGNKAFSSINNKFRQLFHEKTIKEIQEGKRKDVFFIVLDISHSTIDEHQLLNSFLGSLAYTWQIDKSTGKVVNRYVSRKDDSLHDKRKSTDIISGVIYFKQELIFIDNEPIIKIKGDIIQNPHAKNKLTEEEIKKLKGIIFN